MFDPPTIVYTSLKALNTGFPSVIWQQEMEKAYLQRFNNIHMTHKTLPTYERKYTKDFDN